LLGAKSNDQKGLWKSSIDTKVFLVEAMASGKEFNLKCFPEAIKAMIE